MGRIEKRYARTMSELKPVSSPKPWPKPDRYAALASALVAIIGLLVAFDVLPGHSDLAQLDAEELAYLIERAMVLAGVVGTLVASWRGKLEAAK